eukprot:jgi/Bigna1/130539/aug1.11_g5247
MSVLQKYGDLSSITSLIGSDHDPKSCVEDCCKPPAGGSYFERAEARKKLLAKRKREKLRKEQENKERSKPEGKEKGKQESTEGSTGVSQMQSKEGK